MNELGRCIIEVLERKGEVDFDALQHELHPDGWAKAYGIEPEEYRDVRRKGVRIVNPYIKTLNMLIAEGKIRRYVDRRLEAGVERLPRFAYSLA